MTSKVVKMTTPYNSRLLLPLLSRIFLLPRHSDTVNIYTIKILKKMTLALTDKRDTSLLPLL